MAEQTGLHIKTTGDSKQAVQSFDALTQAELRALKAGDRLVAGSQRVDGALFNVSRRTKSLAKQQRLAAMQTANMTAQFNDIGVMLAAGQNPLMLAVQQGTQINQVFDQMGTKASKLEILSAGLRNVIKPANLMTFAVIAGVAALTQFGMKLYRAQEDARKWSDILGEAETAQKDFLDSLKAVEEGAVGLGEKFDLAAIAVREFNLELLNIERRNVAGTIQGLINKLTELDARGFRDLFNLKSTNSAERQLTGAIAYSAELFKQAQTLDEQIAAGTELLRIAKEAAAQRGGRTSQEDTYIKQLAETLKFMVQRRDRLAEQASKYDDIIGSEEGLKLSTQALNELYAARLGTIDATANTYVDILGSEAGLAQAVAANNELFAERLRLMNAEDPLKAFGGEGPFIPSTEGPFFGDDDTKPGRGSRGRSPFERTQEDFERLRDSLMTEEEIQLEAYARQQEILNQARANELITEQEHAGYLQQIQREHGDKMVEIAREERFAKSRMMQGAFGDLATLMQTGSSKLFKIGQAAAIAQATMAGYEAAVHAWDKGMAAGGPPMAAAFTAASLARTGALIASIASQSANGGGAGAGGAAGIAAAAPAELPRQNVVIDLPDQEYLSRNYVLNLINGINEAVDDGAVVRLSAAT